MKNLIFVFLIFSAIANSQTTRVKVTNRNADSPNFGETREYDITTSNPNPGADKNLINAFKRDVPSHLTTDYSNYISNSSSSNDTPVFLDLYLAKWNKKETKSKLIYRMDPSIENAFEYLKWWERLCYINEAPFNKGIVTTEHYQAYIISEGKLKKYYKWKKKNIKK